jgi:hypothetical protein
LITAKEGGNRVLNLIQLTILATPPPGVRDGAVIVRYFHQFYTDAGFVPTTKNTAHLSLTVDMDPEHLFIH